MCESAVFTFTAWVHLGYIEGRLLKNDEKPMERCEGVCDEVKLCYVADDMVQGYIMIMRTWEEPLDGQGGLRKRGRGHTHLSNHHIRCRWEKRRAVLTLRHFRQSLSLEKDHAAFWQ